ncbi:MAG: VWA domain-containing protein [Halobacteriales archaeon]
MWFESPLLLLLIPVGVAALYYALIADGTGSKRRRYAILGSRILIVTLLVVAFAQPYVVQTASEEGEERVHVLIDGSESMEVFDDVGDEVATAVESRGIDVETTRIGQSNSSRIGDDVMSNIERDGSVLLVSDGQVTGGRSLVSASEAARSLNAQVNAVNLSATEAEKSVRLEGPSKASQGVEETFSVCLGGVNLDETGGSVTVEIDGEQVAQGGSEEGCEEFSHTFDSTGTYEMTATVEDTGQDTYSNNNEFYKTVRVVERPRVLYVSQDRYPFAELLNELYDVETVESVPSDLSEYYAVVMQNTPADSAGDLEALQEYVIDGGGLLVAGGPNAYDTGGYDESILGDMVPVESGETSRTSDVVLLIDISGSTEEDIDVQKGLALDAVEQMGDGNRVGVVAFNQNAYDVQDMRELASARGDIERSIQRLEASGSTDISIGLQGAEDMLGGSGNVILISDGIVDEQRRGTAVDTARRLGAQDINVISVGVGETTTDEDVMREIADVSGGSFFRATDAERLSVLFGGEDREPEGDGLSIVDSSHFITDGVETSADLPTANEVSVKSTGRFLVSTGSGDVALASGRYGLGRVVSVTAHTGNGVLGGLLNEPDSALVSRSVNWAIGDPERPTTDVYDVEDTRIGETTEISYRGESRPSSELDFSQRSEDTYVATVTPSEPGFESAGDATYAVNYAAEYAGFGMSSEIYRAAESTGGGVYEPSETEEIAQEVRSHSSEPRETQQDLSWIPLLLALLVYLVEVSLRRINDIYGYDLRTAAREAVEAIRART